MSQCTRKKVIVGSNPGQVKKIPFKKYRSVHYIYEQLNIWGHLIYKMMTSLAMYQTKFRHTDKKVCYGYVIHKCLDRLRGYLELFQLQVLSSTIQLPGLDERTPPNK